MTGEPGNGEVQNHGPEEPKKPKAGDKSTGRQTQPPATSTGQTGGSSQDIPRFENPADIFNIAAEGDLKDATKDDSGEPEEERMSYGERLKKGDQTKSMPDDINTIYSDVLNSVQGREDLDNDVEADIIGKLQNSNTSQEQAMIIFNSSTLSPEAKQRIISKLKLAKDLPKTQEPSDIEKMQMQAGGDVMGKMLADKEKEVEVEIKKEEEKLRHDPSHSEEHKEHFERTREKIHELKERMYEYFHPEDGLKDWAKRGGKYLYFVFLTAFILLIAEMNLINRMSGKGARGGH